MKRYLASILFLALFLSVFPAYADTMYCPYCGKQVNSSFSFCPSCGKSLKELWNQEESSQTDYELRMVPGFNHTYSELKNIIYQLFNNPNNYVGRTRSSFPIKMSIDLRMKDGITSMRFPNRILRTDYSVECYEWRYDISRDTFITEDEKFSSPVKIYFQYFPNSPEGIWQNVIIIQMGNTEEITLFSVSYTSNVPEIEEDFLISNQEGKRIIDLAYYKGRISVY